MYVHHNVVFISVQIEALAWISSQISLQIFAPYALICAAVSPQI